LGYRNEIYRVAAVETPPVKRSLPEALGSFCVPAVLKDWPSRGWVTFEGIEKAEQSATRANAKDSSIDGLSYSVHHCHENDQEKIFLRLDSWCYDKYGETTDLPVMECIFDAKTFNNPVKALESLKVMARPIRLTEKVASRAINAALFLINQINTEQVPDFERVLELHRIHPGAARFAGHLDNNKTADQMLSIADTGQDTGMKSRDSDD
jgi:hypothetical protein